MPFCFVLDTQAGVFIIRENSHLGCRNRDLSNLAGPPSHMNTPIFYGNRASLVNWAHKKRPSDSFSSNIYRVQCITHWVPCSA